VSQLRSSDHVIVVGAGLAGWRFVESLRAEGFQGAITLVGDEPYAPYDRPPLSKQVLTGKWEVEKATLASPQQLAESGATLRLGVRANQLDVEATSVRLADDSLLVGTHVVLATGSRARPLSFAASGALATLRNRDDLVHLDGVIGSLGPGSAAAVIGGGFVGAEVATSMKARGLTPIVLEAAERPLIAALGEEASTWLLPLAANAEVELRTNQRLDDVRKVNRGFILDFDDGTDLPAKMVLAAVGSSLDLGWLANSGLTLDDGVVVDRDLQAAPQVAAIGDVARFVLRSAIGDEAIRVEHWQIATEHAGELAHFWMSGERASHVMVPYFWSDQYGEKIQMLGHPHPSDEVVIVSGSPEEGRWLALYSRDRLISGVLSLSHPRHLALAKPLLESPIALDDALRRAPWLA
jgi:3-phenylpropionate/trans-cinnamate dioxygenase ferredoxin reductase subunit